MIRCNPILGKGVQKGACGLVGELLGEVDQGRVTWNAESGQSCRTIPLYPSPCDVFEIEMCHCLQNGRSLNGFDR